MRSARAIRTAGCSLALTSWLLSTLCAAQQPAPAIDYCAAGDPAALRAQADVRALGVALADPGESLAALQARYQALLETPCFAPARAGGAGLTLGSRAVARAWWAEGGLDWLWHYAMGRAPGAALEVVLAPEERPALSLEASAPDHRLRALLCGEDDARCGLETAGWSLRAEQAFAAHARAERERERELATRSEAAGEPPEPASDVLACTRAAADWPTSERFPRWLGCVEQTRERTTSLPVTRIRAPAQGWLVIRGRRGHYTFCDELRAYDLASGSAYVASSCSGLALRSDGSVHGPATDAARTANTTVGRVPIEALREAAWMLLLASEVDDQHMSVADVTLPPSVSTRWVPGALYGTGSGSAWSTSAQTQLSWAWVEGRRTLAEGTLTWPDSYRASEDHAGNLLEIAEAALSSGCAPSALPRSLVLPGGGGGVSGIDAEPGSLRRSEEAVAAALRAIRAPRCRR